jgi:GntR family transcriptional regulator
VDFDLDSSSPVPLYLQIADRVRREVALGALLPGQRLPTIRELALLAKVNRNTAARAVQLLESEGLVRTRVGQGTFLEASRGPIDPSRRDSIVDDALDRLLVEAHTLGLPLEELGWRLSSRIEAFLRQRRSSVAATRADHSD